MFYEAERLKKIKYCRPKYQLSVLLKDCRRETHDVQDLAQGGIIVSSVRPRILFTNVYMKLRKSAKEKV